VKWRILAPLCRLWLRLTPQTDSDPPGLVETPRVPLEPVSEPVDPEPPPPRLVAEVIEAIEAEDEDEQPMIADLTVEQLPAHGGAQTPGNRDASDIDMIVIHTAEGERPAHWFADSRSPASAHYSVYKTGRILQSVPDKDVAWHAGNWSVNQRSLGIETSAFAARGDWTDVQLLQLARLVAALCRKYSIPIDRQHIVGHVEVSGPGGHTDPGPHFNWRNFMATVKQIARGGGVGTVVAFLTMTPWGIPVWVWGVGLAALAMSAGAILGTRPPRLT